MTARPFRETGPIGPDANERLKRWFSGTLWLGLVAATVLHFAVFAFWPELTAPDVSVSSDAMIGVIAPPDVILPTPPDVLTRPAAPVIGAVDVPSDATIAPTTFEQNPPDRPAPPPETRTTSVGGHSTILPFTVAPRLVNADEVVRVMERRYPAVLRDAGIGGTVDVYIHVDADGSVLDARLARSSGHERLDRAALAVVFEYRFTPALNRDQRVPVWVEIPVTFRVR